MLTVCTLCAAPAALSTGHSEAVLDSPSESQSSEYNTRRRALVPCFFAYPYTPQTNTHNLK